MKLLNNIIGIIKNKKIILSQRLIKEIIFFLDELEFYYNSVDVEFNFSIKEVEDKKKRLIAVKNILKSI